MNLLIVLDIGLGHQDNQSIFVIWFVKFVLLIILFVINRKKRTAGCVVLTTENSWRVVDCNRKLPFICEIFTSEPRKSINLNKECLERKDFNYF